MLTNFCYKYATETKLIKNGRKLVCSECGLSNSQAKKYVNSKGTKKLAPKHEKTPESKKDHFCHACNQTTRHNFERGRLWCDVCGRDESAAISYKIVNERNANLTKRNIFRKNEAIPMSDNENKYLALDPIEFIILSTLMTVFFPWSLLFCFLFYGIEETKLIVVALLHDFLKLVWAVFAGIVMLIIIVSVLIIMFSSK
jgi:hypothetical protein